MWEKVASHALPRVVVLNLRLWEPARLEEGVAGEWGRGPGSRDSLGADPRRSLTLHAWDGVTWPQGFVSGVRGQRQKTQVVSVTPDGP